MEESLGSFSGEDKTGSILLIKSKRRSKRNHFSKKNNDKDEKVETILNSHLEEDETNSNLLIRIKRRNKTKL